MKNLLKADLFRLFKSKSFYICTAVAVFLMSLNIFLQDWANRMLENAKQPTIPLPYKDGLSYGLNAFSDGNVLMIISIFIAIFVTAEFSHGTMKNAVSKGFAKLQIYLSKVVTMMIAAFVMIAVTFVTNTISATIVIGDFGSFTGSFAGILLKTVGIELLLNTALTALLVMIAMVVRNLGGVIAINIVGVMSLEMLLWRALELLFRSKIKFSDFSLMYNIMFYSLNDSAVGSDYLRSAIVGVAFFAVTTVFGILIFKKADVK